MDLSERKNQEGELQKNRVGILSHPDSDLDPPEENLLSSLDLILNLEVSPEEIMRRIQGRRIDPITKTIYHIEDNPAPLDIKGLNERLLVVNDEFSDGKTGKNEDFYEKIEEMKEWYLKFVNFNGKNVLQNIGGKGKFEVFEGVEKEVFGLLEKKHEEYEVLLGENENRKEIEVGKGECEEVKKEFEVGNVDLEAAKILWTLWDETQNSYLKEIYKTLRKFKENRYFSRIFYFCDFCDFYDFCDFCDFKIRCFFL